MEDTNLSLIKNIIDSVERVNSSYLYIIDHTNRNILYTSDNIKNFTKENDLPIEKIWDSIFFKSPMCDYEYFRKAMVSFFSYIENVSILNKTEYTFFLSFELLKGHESISVLHKCTPILLTEGGCLRLSLCSIIKSTSKSRQPAFVMIKNQESYLELNYDSSTWCTKKVYQLNKTERAILYYSSIGYQVKEIASKLFLSVDAVKSSKHLLFERIGVNNIISAISYFKDRNLM